MSLRIYRAGLASITSSPGGLLQVRGNGTLWANGNILPGDTFWKGNLSMIIEEVVDDEELTLAGAWEGSEFTDEEYFIFQNSPDRAEQHQMTETLLAVLERQKLIFNRNVPLFSVKQYGITSIPGDAVEDDLFVVASAGATGSLAGHENELAIKTENGVAFLVPEHGWHIDSETDVSGSDVVRHWTGTEWESAGALASVPTFVGTWDSGTDYTTSNIVLYEGTLWVADEDNTNNPPDGSPSVWSAYGHVGVHGGGFTIQYTFRTATDATTANTSGNVNASLALGSTPTTLRVNVQDAFGTSFSALLALIGNASTSNIKGKVRLVTIGDYTKQFFADVTAAASAGSGARYDLTISNPVAVGSIEDGASILFMFSAKGDKGDAGAASSVAGPQGAPGGAYAIPLVFDPSTVDSNPGAGEFRLNAGTQNTATVLRVNDADANGASIVALIADISNATNDPLAKGRLYKPDDPSDYLSFDVTAVTDAVGYTNLTISIIGSSAASPFSADDDVIFDWVPLYKGTEPGPQGEAFSPDYVVDELVSTASPAANDRSTYDSAAAGTSVLVLSDAENGNRPTLYFLQTPEVASPFTAAVWSDGVEFAVSSDSANVVYDNTVSGLDSTNVQNAIDELAETVSEGGEVTASGGVTSRTLTDHFSDTIYGPKNFDAQADGLTDDSVALNALTDAAFAAKNATTKSYPAYIALSGRSHASFGSIDLTGFVGAWGLRFGGGTITSLATGKIAIDLTATRGGHLENLLVQGNASSVPDVGVFYGRNSDSDTAPENVATNLRVYGSFGRAGIQNFASEVNNWRCVFVENDKRDTSAYAIKWMGTDTAPPTSDFQSVLNGSASNIMFTGETITGRRVNKANGVTITGITKANPAVVTYTGPDLFANGDAIILADVGGMTEVNNIVFTIAGLNTGAKTFQLSGINSTAYTTYTSGGSIWFRTGPAFYWADGSAHFIKNLYGVVYGAHGAVIESAPGGLATHDFRKLHVHAHFEGYAITSLIHFKGGNNVIRMHDWQFSEHNSHAKTTILSTDVSGANGKVIFENCRIEIQNFSETPGAFFDNPTKYQFNGNSELFLGESDGIGADEIGKLLRKPHKIVMVDAVNPIRYYNGIQSPGHVQQLDHCSRLFASLSSTSALQYDFGWLDRVGSSAGPTLSSVEAFPGRVRLSASGGTAFNTFGAHRRSGRMFRPDQGEMIFDATLALASNTDARNNVIGFGSTATTSALATTDNPCTLASNGVATFNDTDFFGICFDDTLTVKTWRAVACKAGVAQSTSTGVAVSTSAVYFSLFVDTSGNGYVFYSSDGEDFSLVATITNACTASTVYAAVMSAKLVSGTAARAIDLYRLDARCLWVP